MRRFKEVLLLFGCVLLVFLSGCKSAKKVGTVEAGEAKEEVEFFNLMLEQSFQFQTLNARLDADITLPDKSLSSRVNLKMIRDSVLQFSVQPLLGIEVFRLQLSPNRILLIDRMNKRYVDESYEEAKGQLPIDFNFYNLQALFTNRLFLPGEQAITPKQYNRFKLDQEGASSEIRAKDKMGLLYTFLADGEQKLLSTRVQDDTGAYALSWDYTDFRLQGAQPFPMRMQTHLLAKGKTAGDVVLKFSKIETDKGVDIDASVPAKYERVTIAQLLKSLSKKKE